MADFAVGQVLILAFVIGVQASKNPNVIHNDIPEAARAFCKVNVSSTTYRNDPLTMVECMPDTLKRWERLQKHGAVEAGGGTCTIDHIAKRMHCVREKQCEVYSGHTDSYSRHQHTTKMSYDCKSACGHKGGLLKECCNTCSQLEANPTMLGEWNGFAIQSVACLGCSKSDIHEADQTDPNCVMTNGAYHCSTSSSCEIPPPAPGKDIFEDYECETQTCSACDGDIQAKALCCTNCLKRLCGNPSNLNSRLACLGCGDDIPQKYNGLVAEVPASQPFAQALPLVAEVPASQPFAQALPSEENTGNATPAICVIMGIVVLGVVFATVSASQTKATHDDYQSFSVEEAHVVE